MKSFRTIEVSDPIIESNGLQFLTVKSHSLKSRADVIVSKPAQPAENLPVIIFLHGVYGSAWSWPLKSGVHLKVADMIKEKIIPPTLLVFPSDGLWGDGSGYVPHDGKDFEKWIAEEVPQLILQQYPQVTKKSKFFITGLSMGGFGALRIGARYHKRFTSFSGHSSITHLEQMGLFTEEGIDHYLQQRNADNSVFETILENREHAGSFRFDCGKQDPLLAANKKLHQQLKKAGIPHDFETMAGGHEWPYWEKNIIRSILFFANLF